MRKPLFTPRRYLQSRTDIITPPTGRGRCEWVMSRGLCHYRLFSLTDIPAAHQDDALRLKIRQWSPFADYVDYSVWQNGQVQVWVWERNRQQQALEETGIKHAYHLPESVLYQRPTTDTVQLLKGLDGTEGQIWQNNLLVGSRWWTTIPTLAEWNSFLRAHSLPVSDTVPTALTVPLLNQAWGKPRVTLGGINLRQERVWVLLGIALFVIISSWQLVTIWQWRQALTQVQSRIDNLNERTTPVLKARNDAVADKQAAERLLALNSYPAPLELLTQVAEKLPRNGARLVEWIYQTGELHFTIEAPEIDPRVYVEAFQTVPLFQEVKSEMGRAANQIIMSMRVAKKPL